MFLSIVYKCIPTLVKDQLRGFFFNSTLDVFREALLADTASQAAELLLAQAAERQDEFWMDVLLLASFFIIFVLFTNCAARCFCWICIGIPRQLRDIEEMRKGTKDYQVKAAKEREERRRRREAGEPTDDEDGTTLQQDMQMLTQAMAKLQKNVMEDKQLREVLTGANASASPGEPAASADASSRGMPSERPVRAFPPAAPASSLRGFPTVDIFVASPNQQLLLVGCRAKRRTHVYRMRPGDRAFLSRGRDMKEGADYAAVEPVVAAALPGAAPSHVEVYSGAFASADDRLIVGERSTDTMVVLQVSAGAAVALQLVRTTALPQKRLVSSLPADYSYMASTESLVCLHDADCVVEQIRVAAPLVTHKDKFKLGSATAWALREESVAVGGSFMREPRLARMVPRSPDGFSLQQVCAIPNAARLRVLALAIVLRGCPTFNTNGYLITFMENGQGTVYDTESLMLRNEPEVAGTFEDAHFAGYDAEDPVRMEVCVSGQAYQETLHVALVQGPNIAVLKQTRVLRPFTLERLLDLGATQGDASTPVRRAAFVLSGAGIATCADGEGKSVRLFALPDKTEVERKAEKEMGVPKLFR